MPAAATSKFHLTGRSAAAFRAGQAPARARASGGGGGGGGGGDCTVSGGGQLHCGLGEGEVSGGAAMTGGVPVGGTGRNLSYIIESTYEEWHDITDKAETDRQTERPAPAPARTPSTPGTQSPQHRLRLVPLSPPFAVRPPSPRSSAFSQTTQSRCGGHAREPPPPPPHVLRTGRAGRSRRRDPTRQCTQPRLSHPGDMTPDKSGSTCSRRKWTTTARTTRLERIHEDIDCTSGWHAGSTASSSFLQPRRHRKGRSQTRRRRRKSRQDRLGSHWHRRPPSPPRSCDGCSAGLRQDH